MLQNECIIREGVAEDLVHLFEYIPELKQIIADYPIVPNDLPNYWFNTTPEMLPISQISLSTGVFVAETKNQLIGLAIGRSKKYKQNQHVCAMEFFVKEEHRNQGIGTELVNQMVSWAEKNPAVRRLETLLLSENEKAKHILVQTGFVIEGQFQNSVRFQNQLCDSLMLAYYC